MTAYELLIRVNDLMFGEVDDLEDYEPLFSTFANIILADCFYLNNAVRLSKGKQPLEIVPNLVLEGASETTIRRVYDDLDGVYTVVDDVSEMTDKHKTYIKQIEGCDYEIYEYRNKEFKMIGTDEFEVYEEVYAEDNKYSTVPYENIIIENLLVWGIAGRLWLDDEDVYAREYTQKYEMNKQIGLGTQYVPIDNVY